jgi:hypothetical protein
MNELEQAILRIFNRVKYRMQLSGYHIDDCKLWELLCERLSEKSNAIWIYNRSINTVDVFRKGMIDRSDAPNSNP